MLPHLGCSVHMGFLFQRLGPKLSAPPVKENKTSSAYNQSEPYLPHLTHYDVTCCQRPHKRSWVSDYEPFEVRSLVYEQINEESWDRYLSICGRIRSRVSAVTDNIINAVSWLIGHWGEMKQTVFCIVTENFPTSSKVLWAFHQHGCWTETLQSRKWHHREVLLVQVFPRHCHSKVVL